MALHSALRRRKALLQRLRVGLGCCDWSPAPDRAGVGSLGLGGRWLWKVTGTGSLQAAVRDGLCRGSQTPPVWAAPACAWAAEPPASTRAGGGNALQGRLPLSGVLGA